MEIAVREATTEDIPQIVQIMNYYIRNSVASFRTELLTPESYLATWKEVKSQHLPFFVSVKDQDENYVLGFSYASGFRMPAFQAYHHTAEISVYVDQNARTRGVGTKLMHNLMDALKNPNKAVSPNTKQILGIMSVDVEGPDNGSGLRDWYGRWGFCQVGEMKKVGDKFGRIIDVLILQASFEDGEEGK